MDNSSNPLTLRLGFEPQAFADAVSQELQTPGVKPIAAATRFISNGFALCMQACLGDRLIKPPLVKLHSLPTSGYFTLDRLSKTGHELWYTELSFSTRHTHSVPDLMVQPLGYALQAIDYGGGVKRHYQLKIMSLKTRANHELRLNHIHLPPSLWKQVLSTVASGPPLAQPYIPNPAPGMEASPHSSPLEGYRTVSFDHMLDGSRTFCSCARPAHVKMIASASAVIGEYVPGSWPNDVVRLLEGADYQDDICHLCVARASGPEAVALRYGDNLQDFEEPYLDQFTVGLGLDVRTARAEVQQLLGITRWKSEALMFSIVKELLKDYVVQREASPRWLGRQRLDVYVPELKLALEYQGAQHYQPVQLFGGAEGLRMAAERDALKKRLCDENGVGLLYILHSDPLTPAAIRRRLQRFMPS